MHHDALVRTTVTLEPDVQKLLEDAAHRERKSFKAVLNEAIRRGLSPRPQRARRAYRVVPHQTDLRPGIDSAALSRLADELEDEAVSRKLVPRGRK
jgi:hypothetical protein